MNTEKRKKRNTFRMHAAYFVKTEVFDVSRLDKFINVTVIQMHKILNPHKN